MGTCPSGSLPVFSVNNKEEAELLIDMACPLSYSGDYVAPELIQEQTLENLQAFGDRLKELYEKHIRKDNE